MTTAIGRDILARLPAQLHQPAPRLKDLHLFTHWGIVQGERPAMATLFREHYADHTCYRDTYLGELLGQPVSDIANQSVDSEDPLRQAVVMTCLKVTLSNRPEPKDELHVAEQLE